MNLRYPHRGKHLYALLWPAQAVKVDERGRITLPLGRGQPSLCVDPRRAFPFEVGACKLTWNDGWELHVISRQPVDFIGPRLPEPVIEVGPERATVRAPA